jgi:hypothetical protein
MPGSFHESARQWDKKALQVIAAILMDENQPASLRLAAANDLLDRAYGRPPVAIDATTQDLLLKKVIHEVRWLPPDREHRLRHNQYLAHKRE